MPRPIRATISAARSHTICTSPRRHAGDAKVWAVLKANAYGHGLERAARALAAADGFAVLDFQEAARLRVAGVDEADPDAGGLLQAGRPAAAAPSTR